MRSIRHLAPTVIPLALALGACAPEPPPAPEAYGERLEAPALGLALASVPAAFEEVGSDESSWSFEAPGEQGAGRLVLTVGPEVAGSINLVESVKARKEAFESTAGGTYHGNRELGGPFGTIYTARGAYPGDDGQPVEETWAYAIHPGAYRLLTVRYTYPTGESGTRVEQLMEFLGEIEALGAGDAEG